MEENRGKRPTLGEVAALAGVSRSAVSRTFTEGASVSTLTRTKVEQAASQLGQFVPKALKRFAEHHDKVLTLIMYE